MVKENKKTAVKEKKTAARVGAGPVMVKEKNGHHIFKKCED